MKSKMVLLALGVAATVLIFSFDSAQGCWRRRCRCSCSPSTWCSDNTGLSWRFQPGKPFYQEITTSTKQTMNVMGMEVTQTQSQTFYFSFTPIEQDRQKNWIVVRRIEGVKVEIESDGQSVSYDSTTARAATGNWLAEFYNAIVGLGFKLTISPEMIVIKIEGRDEYISKLMNANPQLQPCLKYVLSEGALGQMLELGLVVIPNKVLTRGETWRSEKKTLNMGPLGSYETVSEFTFDGREGRLFRIKSDATLEYTRPTGNIASSLPFQILEGTRISSKGVTGVILFDNEKHRLDSSSRRLELEGTLKIGIGGMASEVRIVQVQTTAVKTFDMNPLAVNTPASAESAGDFGSAPPWPHHRCIRLFSRAGNRHLP